jgi:hypothetical protein
MSKYSRMFISGLLMLSLMLVFFVVGCSQQQAPSPSPTPPASDNSAQPPANQPDTTVKSATYGSKSAALKTTWTSEEMLQFAMEDEYMARAEYKYVIAAFGSQNPFTNIVASEETHINSLKGLYDSRKMTVPADNSGQYLVKPGNIKDSLALGVEAEIANINMYKNFLNAPNLPDDVKIVFTQLKAGSENHLNAFQNGLNRY